MDARQQRALANFIRAAKALRHMQIVSDGEVYTLDELDDDDARAFDEALDDMTLAGLPT